MLGFKSNKSDWFWSQSIVLQSHSKPKFRWTWPEVGPEVAILGADQKEREVWERECAGQSRIDMRSADLPITENVWE